MRLDNLGWVCMGDRPRLLPRLGWLSLGTAVGVAALVFLLALVAGLQGVIMTRILGMVPDQLEVVPATMSVGPLQFQSGGSLDPAALDKLAHLPGVKAVYRRARLSIPSELTAQYHHYSFVTDIIIEGVDDGLLHPEFGNAFGVQPAGQPAPAVLAGTMIDMLNAGLSVHIGKTGLSRTALVGIPFNLVIGRSSFRQSATAITVPCQLIGISDHVVVSGPTLPYSYLESWSRAAGGALDVYGAVLQLTGPEALQSVAAQVTGMGFQCPKQKQAVWVAGAARAVQAGLVCFCGVLLVVAGVGIANGLAIMVQEERTDIGLMRALGARQQDVEAIFLTRAALLGCAGSGVGILVGVALTALVPSWAAHWMPASILTDTPLFKLTVGGILGPFCFGTVASILAGVLPARQASRLRPSDALRS